MKNDFLLYTKAKELLEYTITISKRKDMKQLRFTVCNRMIDLAMKLIEEIGIANSIQKGDSQRIALQSKIIVQCDIFNTYVEVLYNTNCITGQTMGVWGKKSNDIKYMTMKWRSKEK